MRMMAVDVVIVLALAKARQADLLRAAGVRTKA